MSVHGFVLHLKRAHARQENAHALGRFLTDLRGMGRVQVWEAVDGAAMAPSDLAGMTRPEIFEPHYPFDLKPGEVGCFLSHRQIWAEMLARNARAALILEDDAQIDPALFAQAFALAEGSIDRLGYIQFQTRAGKGPAVLIDTNGPCQLTVSEQAGLRTTAQMISQEAARHLLDRSEQFDRPVDTFVQSHWHTGLRPAAILPSGVSELPAESTIQKSRKSLWEKLRREFARRSYRREAAQLARYSPAPAHGGLTDE